MVMKNNIKTFPYAQKAEQMEAWIRKFERELRKKQREWKKALPIASQTALIEIKELLGEK